MTSQPKFHWQFTEREDAIVTDSINGSKGKGHKIRQDVGIGRIGNAIQLNGLDSRINLGKENGQFGTRDFTVAFGIKITNTHGQNDTDLIGTRNVSRHGNWFSLRLEDKGRILNFEVDESSKGKNYAVAKSKRLSQLPDKKWHHVAIVRQGRLLKVYLDGAIVAEARSRSGVANISNGVDLKLGHHTRHTPSAFYEDLRIYHQALGATEINALIPLVARPLREGEIELVATDGAAIVLSENIDDLSQFSGSFQKLRVGNHTGVTLFQNKRYQGISQKLYADIPNIR